MSSDAPRPGSGVSPAAASGTSRAVAVLHRSQTYLILHKPAGLPIRGDKPHTLLSCAALRGTTPTVITSVPRAMSGPAIIALSDVAAETLTALHAARAIVFTFRAITHPRHPLHEPPVLPDAAVSVLSTTPAIGGHLVSLRVEAANAGQGLRRALSEAGVPVVGDGKWARPSRTRPRGCLLAGVGVHLACPDSVSVHVCVPAKFDTLLQREQRLVAHREHARVSRVCSLPTGLAVRFCGRGFVVGDAMQPRVSTELVARAAAKALPTARGRLLDLGTGCGAIVITAVLDAAEGATGVGEGATGVGLDVCPKAVAVASRNAALHAASRVQMLRGDFSQLHGLGMFDVVVSNPPYLTEREVRTDEWFFRDDPELALVGGEDGMDGYRAIAKGIRQVLNKDGFLVLEVGLRRDVTMVRGVFARAGLMFHDLVADDRGIQRCLVLRNGGLRNRPP